MVLEKRTKNMLTPNLQEQISELMLHTHCKQEQPTEADNNSIAGSQNQIHTKFNKN